MKNEEIKFNIFLCKDDFREGSRSWRFFTEEVGLLPRQDIDFSILVSMLGQGYIRCLNNLTTFGQGGLQLADTLRKIVNKFVVISYENLDEILSLLQSENFDLITYLVKKDSSEPQTSLVRLFSFVDKVEAKQLLGGSPYHVGYHFNDSNAVISYNIDFFNTATFGAQFASYLAMFKTLVNRINNPYAFTTLVLFMITTDININRFGGYDSIAKMQNVTVGTCKSIHNFFNDPLLEGESKISIFIKNNPKGFMLMTIGIPEFK